MQIYAISFGVYGVVSVFTLMIYGALPAIAAKNGLPPQQIGLLYLSMIPFMLSFFYSGLVESYRKKHACNFERLCLTLGAVSILGFVLLGAVCTPSDILLMSVVFGAMCLLGACAIISLNAIAIEQTSADKKVALNTIMLLASSTTESNTKPHRHQIHALHTKNAKNSAPMVAARIFVCVYASYHASKYHKHNASSLYWIFFASGWNL